MDKGTKAMLLLDTHRFGASFRIIIWESVIEYSVFAMHICMVTFKIGSENVKNEQICTIADGPYGNLHRFITNYRPNEGDSLTIY